MERGILEPPSDLKEKVLQTFAEQKKNFKESNDSSDIAGNILFANSSGNNFFEMIEYFKTIILQDAAVLLEDEEYQNHILFQHEIFKSQEFINYKSELLKCMKETSTPQSVMLSQCVPVISQQLGDVRSDTVVLREQVASLTNTVNIIYENSKAQEG